MSQTTYIGRHKPQPLNINDQRACWERVELGHSGDRNTQKKSLCSIVLNISEMLDKEYYTSSCSRCSSCNQYGQHNENSRWCQERPKGQNHTQEQHSETLQTEDEIIAHFYQLCANENMHKNEVNKKRAKNHVFVGKLLARSSTPYPVMRVKLIPLPYDNEQLGHPLSTSNPTPVAISMITDSGCQSSIIPFRTALAMGIAKSDTAHVKLSMRGEISEDFGVEEGMFFEVAKKDMVGAQIITKQLMYISSKIYKVFICREALVALGAIPHVFLSIPASWLTEVVAFILDSGQPHCQCPKRSYIPTPIPTKFSEILPATTASTPALKQ